MMGEHGDPRETTEAARRRDDRVWPAPPTLTPTPTAIPPPADAPTGPTLGQRIGCGVGGAALALLLTLYLLGLALGGMVAEGPPGPRGEIDPSPLYPWAGLLLLAALVCPVPLALLLHRWVRRTRWWQTGGRADGRTGRKR